MAAPRIRKVGEETQEVTLLNEWPICGRPEFARSALEVHRRLRRCAILAVDVRAGDDIARQRKAFPDAVDHARGVASLIRQHVPDWASGAAQPLRGLDQAVVVKGGRRAGDDKPVPQDRIDYILEVTGLGPRLYPRVLICTVLGLLAFEQAVHAHSMEMLLTASLHLADATFELAKWERSVSNAAGGAVKPAATKHAAIVAAFGRSAATKGNRAEVVRELAAEFNKSPDAIRKVLRENGLGRSLT